MNIVSTRDMKTLESIAMHEDGIPSLQLMRNAASAMSAFIAQQYAKDAKVFIACGPGNNGGDGFALALLLAQAQYENVMVWCMIDEQHMSQDEKTYAILAKNANVTRIYTTKEEEISTVLEQQDVLVDALFGTGLSRTITGTYETIINAMNASNKIILSADIASGIQSDTGEVLGCAIQAHTTISFGCAKLGHMIYPGSFHCGQLQIAPIGILDKHLQRIIHYPIIDQDIASAMLAKRYSHSHKGSYGKALLIGGSTSMHGALTLCAKSMLRSGVGMLTLLIPDTITNILSLKLEESMILQTPSHNGYFAPEAISILREHIASYDTVIIGNGMGRHRVGEELVRIVLQHDIPCILDGDAIFACAKHVELLKHHHAQIMLTPHPKEMSYLTGKSVEEIVSNPFTIATQFAKKYGVIVALKDQYTYISDGEKLFVNTSGNHGLAKGGSGDVLCGIIAGLFAQSKQGLQAAVSGVYVHAKCADLLMEKMDGNSILPSDLIAMLSNVYTSLR